MTNCIITIGCDENGNGGDAFTVKDNKGTLTAVSKKISDYYVSCLSLEYYKKVYEPCRIEAHMQLQYDSNSPTPKKLGELFINKAVKLTIGDKEVAKSYYVHEIVPKYNSSKYINITLKIFSNDKKLTLDKYCKAYTGRKLVEEILKEDLQLVDESWAEVPNEKDSTVPTLLKSAGVTIAEDSQLQFLSYKNGDKEYEFIQPYLVQYNESFYDFLVRTANRCGEFVFFENRQLYVGLPKTIEEKQITSYTSLEYHCMGNLSITGVKDQYYNGVNKNANIVADCDDEVYDFQISHDEYFTKYVKDGWTDFWKEFNFKPLKEMTKAIGQALNNSTMAKVVTAYALNLGKTAVWAAAKSKSNNKEMNEKFYDNFKDEQLATDEDKNSYATPFSSAISGKNLTTIFYSEISKREQTAEENAVTFTIGEAGASIMLANKITINDEKYIVTAIDGSIGDLVEYKVTAVPIQKIDNTDLICPPPFGGESTRKSSPQIAIVADIDDPSRLARVRIRYTWQKENQDMSPWIRMAVPFAPESGGVYFEPTVGTELLIDYTGGNVERPYVVGQLFARKGRTSKTVEPETRIIASTNGQKIVLDDEDACDMFSGLSGFYELWGGELPDVEKLKGFTGGIKMTDAYGIYTISMSTVDRNISIKSPFGDVKINAFTGISISAPNGDIAITGKNVKITANNRLEITSGKGIIDGSVLGNAWKNIKKAAGELPKQVADTVIDSTIWSTFDQINMDLIRTIFEAFAPPRAGNFAIKSGRYLTLSAGKGKVQFPNSAFTSRKIGMEAKEKTDVIGVVSALRNIPVQVDLWLKTCEDEYKKVQSDMSILVSELNNNTVNSSNSSPWTTAGINDIIKTILDNARKRNFTINQESMNFTPNNGIDPITVIRKASDLACQMDKLSNIIKKPTILNSGWYDKDIDLSSYFEDDENLQPEFCKNALKAGYDMSGTTFASDAEKKKIKRKLAIKYIKGSSVVAFDKKKESLTSSAIDKDEDWITLVDSCDAKAEENTVLGAAWDYVKDKITDTLFPIDWIQSRNSWGTLKTGEILFSDKSGKTINFENGHLNYVENADVWIKKIKAELKEDF